MFYSRLRYQSATSLRLQMRRNNDNPNQRGPARRRLPRSFKELTPSHHFKPRKFFYELVWKALLTRRIGKHKRPMFPALKHGHVALTWIGHASFLIQFDDLNVLVDPNFANWLFLLKRIKRTGLRLRDLPPIERRVVDARAL